MTQVLTVTTQKGGTGKTTTAAALAQAAVYRGKKVLAIDLDPQGNLSQALDGRPGIVDSYKLLNGIPLAALVQATPQGIDFIPASRDLVTVQAGTGSARLLQRALAHLKKKYDVIVIDTPSAGILQYNALQAATGVIMPVEIDTYNIQSLYEMTDTVTQIRASNPDLSFTGIVISKYDGRSKMARELKQTIIDKAAELGALYLGCIPLTVTVKEAAAFRKSLFIYAPKSKVSQEFLRVYDSLTI